MIGNPGIDSQVAQRVDAYQGNPQGLMQQYSKTQQLVDLLALQQLKTQKEAAAKQKMLQMAQAQGQPGTIAEQREKEVFDLTKGELSEKATGVAGILAKAQQDKAAAASAPAPGSPPAPGAPPGAAAGLPTLPSNAAMPAFAQGGIIAFQTGGTTPAGRWWEGVKSGVSGYMDKEKLKATVQKLYGPKSAGAGLLMQQTDAERQEAKDIMSRLDDMSLDELKKLAGQGGAPSAPPAPVSVPTDPSTPVPIEPSAPAAAPAVAAAQPKPAALRPKPPVAAAPPPPPAPVPPPPEGGLPQVTAQPDPLTVAAEKAAMSGIASDPLAQRKAAQDEAFGFTKRTPQEEAGYKDVNEKQAAFDAARFGSGTNWEKIAAALAGGAGHSTLGLTGAGVTTAGLGALAKSREDRNAALKSDFERMDKYNTGSQAIRQKAVETGGAAETAAGQRQGNAMQAAAAMAEGKARNITTREVHALDRTSAEKINLMNRQSQEAIHALDRKAQADIHANHDRLQSEANAAVREGTAAAKAGQLWAQAAHYTSQARADADKQFEKAAAPFRNAIAMARPGEKYEQETKAPKAELALLENRLNDQYKSIDVLFNGMITQATGRATGGKGLESLDTGGMKVVKKTP